jgi:hypothetical protein
MTEPGAQADRRGGRYSITALIGTAIEKLKLEAISTVSIHRQAQALGSAGNARSRCRTPAGGAPKRYHPFMIFTARQDGT